MSLSARLPFTSFRTVDDVKNCTQNDVTYMVDGVFYRNGKAVLPANIPASDLLLMVTYAFTSIVQTKPDVPQFGDTYLEDTVYKRWNGYNWISVDKKFIEKYFITSRSRDQEEQVLVNTSKDVQVVSTNDLFIRKGIWNPAKNEPAIADGDTYPNFSVFLVSSAENGKSTSLVINKTVITSITAVVNRDVEPLPADVQKKGVHNMDFVVKINNEWKVVHNTKLPVASDIKYDEKRNLKEAVDELSKRVEDNHEVRFGTFRGYVDNEDITDLALENGSYVINRVNGQVYYMMGDTLKVTISGFVPQFNGRYGDVKPVAGDYNDDQIVCNDGTTLRETIANVKTSIGTSMKLAGFVTKDHPNAPESSSSGDCMFVLESTSGSGWPSETLTTGDMLVNNKGAWVKISNTSSKLNSYQLKMGGKFSENSSVAPEGSILYVDVDQDDFVKGSLVIKIGPDSFVNAFPEVVSASSVTIDSEYLQAKNVKDALIEVVELIASVNKGVGFLHITSDQPSTVAYNYQPMDYGYVEKYVSTGYIYNGSGYTPVKNLDAGTMMMLSRAYEWVIVWAPPRFIKTVKSESELKSVEWRGPLSYVFFTENTDNYKYGDLVNQNGDLMDNYFDSMFERGSFFNSTSLRLSLLQLDAAVEFFLMSKKSNVGELTTEGWASDLTSFRKGDYLICKGTGKVKETSSVLPNTMINDGTLAIFDGVNWNLIYASTTSDMVTFGEETLTSTLQRLESNQITSIGQFVDLTNEEHVAMVKNAPKGRAYKVSTVSPAYADINKGDYVGTGVKVLVPAVDLSNIPCYFDKSCLSLEEYLLHRIQTADYKTIENVQESYPNVTRAWSNLPLKLTYDDSGFLSTVTTTEDASGKIFLC